MKSLMFVPSKPKMLGKISASASDAYIIDLEDSIKEEDKEQALSDALEYLATSPNEDIYVRVNGDHLEDEVLKLKDTCIRGYMIPKFENPDNYSSSVRDLIGDKEVIALVETPLGIVNLQQIASCKFVSSIAFGAEDFTSAIGMKNCAEYLNYARSAVVTFGRAYGKHVYDTPSFIIDNEVDLEREIQIAVDMGFDGKLAIHPKQIEKINCLFQYFDIDNIKEIVDQYEAAGQAVLKIGEHVDEKMHISHFKRILKEHNL